MGSRGTELEDGSLAKPSGRMPNPEGSVEIGDEHPRRPFARDRVRRSLQTFAFIAVAILLMAMLYQVVVEAYSEFEDEVDPPSGIDWHIPYGETVVKSNETVTVTGDIIVEGTLYLNDSIVYMASLDPSVVNQIVVKPWGRLVVNRTSITAFNHSIPYSMLLAGSTELVSCTISHLYGKGTLPYQTGGIFIRSDEVLLKGCTVKDCSDGPGIYIYRCSPTVEESTVTNCSIGIRIEVSGEGSAPPIPVITKTDANNTTGQPIGFSAVNSMDSDGYIEYHKWEFGNGVVSSSLTPKVTYSDDGNYSITLTVYDDAGNANMTDYRLQVFNRPPHSNAGSDFYAVEDEPFRLDGTGSYDQDGSVVNYTWDLGGGVYRYGRDPYHTFSTSQVYNVKLRVMDDDGVYNESKVNVTVVDKDNFPWIGYMNTSLHDSLTTSLPPFYPEVRWTNYTGNIDNLTTSFVSSGEIIILTSEHYYNGNSNKSLLFINSSTGNLFNCSDTTISATGSPVLLANGSVAYGLSNGSVICLSPDDPGTIIWSYHHASPHKLNSSLSYYPSAGLISYLTQDGLLVLLHDNGILNWTRSLGGQSMEHTASSPAITDDSVYVSTSVGTLWRVNRTTGAVEWNHSLGAPTNCTPSFFNNSVFIGDESGNLTCILPDKSIRWSFNATDAIRSPPVFYGSNPTLAIFGTVNGYVYALDENNGSVVWIKDPGGNLSLPLVVCDQYMLVSGNQGIVHLLEASSGEVLWSYNLDGSLAAPVLIAAGNVYFRLLDGTAGCIDPDYFSSNGSQSAPYNLSQPPNQPDFIIEPFGIWYNRSAPLVNEVFDVVVRVRNDGGVDGTNVLVRLYHTEPIIGNRIAETTITSLPMGEYKIVTYSITRDIIGLNHLYVEVDPDDNITEANESNNLADKTVIINNNAFAPIISHTWVNDSTIGILTMNITAIEFDNLTLERNDVDARAIASSLTLKNSRYSHPIFVGPSTSRLVVDASSTISIVNDFQLNVFNGTTRLPEGNMKVDMNKHDGSQAFPSKYTDSNGIIGPFPLTHLTIDNGGNVHWYSPYEVYIDPGSTDVSRFKVIADQPKNLTSFNEGDADGDRINDTDEQWNLTIGTDAAAHCPEGSLIITDYKAVDGESVTVNETGVAVHSEILEDSTSGGEWWAFVEARQDGHEVSLNFSVNLTVTYGGTVSAYNNTTLGLNPDGMFHWYRAGPVMMTGAPSNLTLMVTSAHELLRIDRILVTLRDPSDPLFSVEPGHLLDPMCNDTDRDLVMDGYEYSKGRLWYDVEYIQDDITNTSSIPDSVEDYNATNGLSAKLVPGNIMFTPDVTNITNGTMMEFQVSFTGRDDTGTFANQTISLGVQQIPNFEIWDVAWAPMGTPGAPFALVVGSIVPMPGGMGVLWMYTPNPPTLTQLFATGAALVGVEWSDPAFPIPYALFVGMGGQVYRYDPPVGTITFIPGAPPNVNVYGVDINNVGTGLVAGDNGQLFTFNPNPWPGMLLPIASGTINNLRRVAWDPFSTKALVAGSGGTVLEYNGGTGIVTTFGPSSTGTNINLWSCAWSQVTNEAILVGERMTIVDYNGTAFSVRLQGESSDPTLYDVGWKASTNYAVAVGAKGTVFQILPFGWNVQSVLWPDPDNVELYAIDWRQDDDYPLIGGRSFNTGTQTYFTEVFTYLPPPEFNWYINTATGSTPVRNVLPTDHYRWYYSSNFTTDSNFTVHLFWRTHLFVPSYLVKLYVDSFSVECLNYTLIKRFTSGSESATFTFPIGTEESINVNIPENSVVTNAWLEVTGSFPNAVLDSLGPISEPDIYNGTAVYRKWNPAMLKWEIYFIMNVDAGSGPSAPVMLTPLPVMSHQNHPRIYEKYVVYEESQQILMVDISSGTPLPPVMIDPGPSTNPDIYGDWIVFQKLGANWDIYGYHIPSAATHKLTYDYYSNDCDLNDDFDQVNPVIHGQRVVWLDFYPPNGNWDLFMMELNDFWVGTYQYEDMSDFKKSAGYVSRQLDGEVFGRGEIIRIAGTSDDELNPDIHSSTIVWTVENSTSLDKDVYLRDLRTWEDPVPLAVDPNWDAMNARVTGNSVVWHTVPHVGVAGNPSIMFYDLVTDQDRDNIPNFMETPMHPTDLATVVVDSNQVPSTAIYPAVYGDCIVWTNSMGELLEIWQDYGIRIGSWVDTDRDWNCTEIMTLPRRTGNLAGAINEWTDANGFGIVPIVVHSDLTTGTFKILRMYIEIGYPTNPMESDTDLDDMYDGFELFYFFGADILEFEDAVDFKEWKDPFQDLSGKVLYRSYPFIHQSGVTLTTTENYPFYDPGGGPSEFTDSMVRLVFKASESGYHKLTIQPPDRNFVFYTRFCAMVEGATSTIVPVTIRGEDIVVDSDLQNFTDDILQEALVIEMSEYGDVPISPYGTELITTRPVSFQQGMDIGLDWEDQNDPDLDERVSIGLQMDYEGVFYLKENVSYELEISLNLSRVPGELRYGGGSFPGGVDWKYVQLLRIIDLDNIVVSRQSLDPRLSDTDGDLIRDGPEAWSDGFPLNPDADRDGLSDLLEFEYGTDGGSRDTDGDGLRDTVELGYSEGRIRATGGWVSSWGSWFERLLRNGSPFNYTRIDNFDLETANGASTVYTTDPLNRDTDGDGLPDGWIDGWTYKELKYNEIDASTYEATNRYGQMSCSPYSEDRWGPTGEVDRKCQVYEGEDFNLDGAVDDEPYLSTWGFLEETKEIDRGPISGYNPQKFDETSPYFADSDDDNMPDGYEVWMSTQEPYRSGGSYLINPTDGSDGIDDIDVKFVALEGKGFDPGQGPACHLIESKEPGNVIARGVRIGIEEGDEISKVSIQLLVGQTTYVHFRIYDEYTLDHHSDSYMNRPVWSTVIVGDRNGWYTIDVDDSVLVYDESRDVNDITYYYITVWYYLDPNDYIAWLGSGQGTGSHYRWRIDNFGNTIFEECQAGNLAYQLYGYEDESDGLTNLEEYIVGTKLKNSQTDAVDIGVDVIDDALTDGDETLWWPETTDPSYKGRGGIIFRTNIPNGALSYDEYETFPSPTIDYDGNGVGNALPAYRYSPDTSLLANPVVNPDLDFEGFNPENIFLFELEDGTTFYLSPEEIVNGMPSKRHVYMYVFSPDSNLDSTFIDIEEKREFKKVRCLVFKAGQSEIDMDYYRIKDTNSTGEYYRNRMLFLSDPFQPDTDADGILDGHERYWNYTSGPYQYKNWNGWRMESELEGDQHWMTPSDTLINCRDRDSDGDGIEDIEEPGWVIDFDGDGRANMADPDSDDDGVLDGNETQYWMDSDSDGEFWTVNIEYSDSDSETYVNFIYGCNMMDTDSDNDRVLDSCELDPYLVYEGIDGSDPLPFPWKVEILETSKIDMDKVTRVDVGSNGDTYVLYDRTVYSDKILKLPADKVDKEQYQDVTSESGIIDIAVTGERLWYTVDILTYGSNDGIHLVDADGGGHELVLKIDNVGWVDADTTGLVYFVEDLPSIDRLKCLDFQADQTTTVFETDNAIKDIAVDSNGNILVSMDHNLHLVRKHTNYTTRWYDEPIQLTHYDTSDISAIAPGIDGEVYFLRGSNMIRLRSGYDCVEPIHNYYNLETLDHYSGYTTTDVSIDVDGTMGYINQSAGGVIEKSVYSKTSATDDDSDHDLLSDGFNTGSLVGELSTHALISFNVETGVYTQRTHPLNPDMDGDGLMDGIEIFTFNIYLEDWQNATNRTELGYVKCPIRMYKANSDPHSEHSDSDGISDYLEYGYTNPLSNDTDYDGIPDQNEDSNRDGHFDSGETCPVDRDTDDDCLPDGWNDTNRDGKWDIGEEDGEDLNHDGVYLPGLHPDPTNPDTDGDGVLDGIEYEYVVNLTNDRLRDSDGDGYIDLVDYDSDNDGLSDGEENINRDIYINEFKNLTLNKADDFPEIHSGCWGKYSDLADPPTYVNVSQQKDHVINYTWSDGDNGFIEADPFVVLYSGYIFANRSSDSTDYYSVNITYQNMKTLKFRWGSPTWQISKSSPSDPADDSVEWKYDNSSPDHKFQDTGYIFFELEFRNKLASTQTQITLNWSYGSGGFNALTIESMVCTGGNLSEDYIYNIETNATDPDSDDDGLLDGAEADRWSDTDGDGFINAWDQDSNDGIANPDKTNRIDNSSTPGTSDDDYYEVFVVFRRDADSGTFMEYGTNTWLATDPETKDSANFNIYIDNLVLRKYTYSSTCTVGQLPGTLERLIVGYGDPYFVEIDEFEVVTPEGYPVHWYNDSSTYGDIYIDLENGSYAAYTYSTTQSPYTNNTSVPQLESGKSVTPALTNYVVLHQEVYDGRKCLNIDSDFDGLTNNIELIFGTNPYDADTDNDGVTDGAEPFWNIDIDGDGDWVPHPLLPSVYYNTGINALDQDSDGDGVTDGVEMGFTNLHPHSYLDVTPLNEDQSVPDVYNHTNLRWIQDLPEYQIDADPTTTTDPLNFDTDGDGLPDGFITDWNCSQDEDGSLNWTVTTDPDYTGWSSHQKWQGEDFIPDGEWNPSSGETDATQVDTDRDGIPDGYERVFNTTGWIPGNESCEGKIELPTEGDISEFTPLNPLSSNTDGDGLVDALEISWMESLVHDVDYSIYYEVDSDPMSKTNPCHVDTDFDGIPDGEEDKDFNGRLDYGETNASHPDTDGDHLLDGANQDKNGTNDWLESEFNIFIFDPVNYPEWDWSSSSWAEFDDNDPDPDTYYFIGEGNVGTEATAPDTDGDGLYDGDNITANDKKGELVIHFWKNDPNLVLQEPLASTFPIAAAVVNQAEPMDPNNTDTDDDGLTDYMEVSGWDVTIIYEKDKKTHSERWVRSNPLERDTDGDMVYDFDEFSNMSDPIRIDSDGDKILDSKETFGNLTQIEGQNPEVVGDISAKVVVEWDGLIPTMKVEVTVVFRDNAGISLVGIKITDKDWKTQSLGEGITTYEFTAEFGADYWKLLTSGWDIDVKCIDINGNGITGSTHLDGVLEGVIKVILAFIKSLWDAVKEFASKLFSWIWDMVKSIIMKIFEPILTSILTFQLDFVSKLDVQMAKPIMLFIEGGDNESEMNTEDLEDAVTGAGLFGLCCVCSVIIFILLALLAIYLCHLSTIIGPIIKKFLGNIIGNVCETIGSRVGFAFTMAFLSIGFCASLGTEVFEWLVDNSFGLEGLTLIYEVIMFVVAGLIIKLGIVENKITDLIKDGLGLALSLFGGFISLILGENEFNRPQEGALRFLGAFLCIIGLLLGLSGSDFIPGIFGTIDEMLSGLLTGMTLGALIAFL